MADFTNEAHIFIHSDKGVRPIVEVQVPNGTTLEHTHKLERLVYEKLAPEILRFGPCPNCRSGLDFYVKERFENVLRVNLETMEILR